MQKQTSYYVVGREKKLEPVELRVNHGLLIPSGGHPLLPEPLEIKDSEEVTDTSSLPVGSIVAEKSNGKYFHVITERPSYTVDHLGEGGILHPQEKRLVGQVRDVYRRTYSVPGDAERSLLFNALSLDNREGIIKCVEKLHPLEAEILVKILKDLRKEDKIVTSIAKILMEDMLSATRVTQRL